ncbi:MAG: ShlB/FhaC/HecB family hemolysin secretion/activation protein [Gammaproteobacteria bacterium]
MPCYAQQIPSPVQPQPFPETERPKFPTEEIPKIQIEPLGEEAPPGASKTFTVLRDIIVDDSSVYDAPFFRTFFADSIGQKVPLTKLFDIAKSIQQQYRDDGYILTRVIVPPQSVSDGVFHLRVVEGFINSIKVEGKIGPVRDRVQAHLQNLLQNKPVNERELERYLLLANDLPGIHALGFLRSSVGENGASELIVSADRKPFDAYALVNNRGSRYTGPYRFSMMLRENSATFLGEQIEGHFFNTLFDDEQRFGQVTYRQVLNSEGLKFNLGASYAPSKPGHTLRAYDLQTDLLTVTGSLDYPVIRSRKQNLYLDAGFQSLDEQVKFFGQKTSGDRLRVFFVGTSYDLIDDWDGQSSLSLGLRQGMEALGASRKGDINLSRANGNPEHTSLNFNFSRYQTLWEQLGLYLSSAGQYAFNPLMNIEEFKLGGQVYGRGYNPAELSGDSGIAATAEFRYSLPGPFENWQSLQPYSFYDFGAVWNRGTGVQHRQSLSSAGLGVRNQLFDHLSVDLEVAWPLTRAPETYDKDPRFFFQILTHY